MTIGDPPAARMTGARDALRRETRDLHDRVDAVFSKFRLDGAEEYGAFLRAQAGAHLPCEAALDAADASAIVSDWPQRRRGAALLADLAELGLPAPAPGPAPVFAGGPAVLGGIYVLEGSRLGGAMLVRAVPVGLPRRFLGATVPGQWRGLMQRIDAALQSEKDIADAVRAARTVFECFESAGLAMTKVT